MGEEPRGRGKLDAGVADSPRLGKRMPWDGQVDEIYEMPDVKSYGLLGACLRVPI